jgi:hypothetical protein
MKKLSVAALVLALCLGGCAWLGQVKALICGDTAEKVAAYAQKAVQVAETLSYLEILPPTPEVSAAIAAAKQALAVFARIRDGFCATAEEVEAAAKAQDQALATARRYGYRR